VEANSTGCQGSRRAVASSDDDELSCRLKMTDLVAIFCVRVVDIVFHFRKYNNFTTANSVAKGQFSGDVNGCHGLSL
jgi:hypothetical protein